MKELSVGEQRYQAVMAVLDGGRTVTEVARDWAVSRQTMHAWLARYEREGMEGMGNRSHRPSRCPTRLPAIFSRALKYTARTTTTHGITPSANERSTVA